VKPHSPTPNTLASAETYQTLCLSSAHLKLEDAQVLQCHRDTIAQDNYGFHVWLCEDKDEAPVFERLWRDLSPAARKILTDIRDAGFRYAHFDCDAGYIDNYPIFEW